MKNDAAKDSSSLEPREFDLIQELARVLPTSLGLDFVIPEARVGASGRPDLLGMKAGQPFIFEVRSPTPNTRDRLARTIDQMQRYASDYRHDFPDDPSPRLVLVIPGVLSPQNLGYLHSRGVDRIIDGEQLTAMGVKVAGHRTKPAPEDPSHAANSEVASDLLRRLAELPAGKKDWATYQHLVGDILGFALSPPLAKPLSEHANESRVNRRDFVLPNYAPDGFWSFMRSVYEAHYVVVDAKNYVRGVKKQEVLQLANYLSGHGAGLFGMICCRVAPERSAEVTRREQWVIHRKMILVLNDDDLRQMITLSLANTDPSDVIRQKIEDFRLAF